MLTFAIILGILSVSLAFNYSSILEMNTPQMIKYYGYPVEKHRCTTEDGYILTIFRIPRGKNPDTEAKHRPAVILQHGLFSSSDDWLLLGPKKCLATQLVDHGYDVWLPNIRGNRYSRQHVNLTTSDSKYWSFSWDENGLYDLPAIIDYVRRKCDQEKVFYIGHSMGTTMFFVLTSLKPEYNDKIKLMVALAPIAYMSSMKSPLFKLLAPFSIPIGATLKMIGVNEFTPSQELMKMIGTTVCGKFPFFPEVCKNFIFMTCGFDRDQLVEAMLPVIMAHTPAGSSWSQLVHYGQEIYDGRFCRYDYGMYDNLKKYQSTNPPRYPLEKITAPVALIYANNDWLAGLKDIDKLKLELGNLTLAYKVPYDKFNHLDFTYGRDCDELYYPKLWEVMAEHKDD